VRLDKEGRLEAETGCCGSRTAAQSFLYIAYLSGQSTIAKAMTVPRRILD